MDRDPPQSVSTDVSTAGSSGPGRIRSAGVGYTKKPNEEGAQYWLHCKPAEVQGYIDKL
jgi:hypothetical protein